MDTKEALAHYNSLTDSKINEGDLVYLKSAESAIEAIQEISKLVENAGGKLKSRQTMATIIYFAEKNFTEKTIIKCNE